MCVCTTVSVPLLLLLLFLYTTHCIRYSQYASMRMPPILIRFFGSMCCAYICGHKVLNIWFQHTKTKSVHHDLGYVRTHAHREREGQMQRERDTRARKGLVRMSESALKSTRIGLACKTSIWAIAAKERGQQAGKCVSVSVSENEWMSNWCRSRWMSMRKIFRMYSATDRPTQRAHNDNGAWYVVNDWYSLLSISYLPLTLSVRSSIHPFLRKCLYKCLQYLVNSLKFDFNLRVFQQQQQHQWYSLYCIILYGLSGHTIWHTITSIDSGRLFLCVSWSTT